MDEAVPEQPMFRPPELLLSPSAAMSPEAIERSVRSMPAPTTPEYMDIDDGGLGPVLGPPRPSSLSPLPSSLPATPLDDLAPQSSSPPALIRSNSSSSLDMQSSPSSLGSSEQTLGPRINTAGSDSVEEFVKLLMQNYFGSDTESDQPEDQSPDPICSPQLHVSSNLESIQSSTPQAMPLQYLKEITNNFSDERILGHGGFGVVYKGVLQNGEMIAVKRIMPSFVPGMKNQFEDEVIHLIRLEHPNIVQFKGYCYEIQNECLEYNGKHIFAEATERLLCLEYLPNGSLDKYLSDESSGLNWNTRYKIIEGICYGLCHLHEQVGKPIIHLDLKPANILLDDAMVPKITDFGLSRLLDQQRTICTSSRYGTPGYMAPEFVDLGTITPKSDIFSLGVIIVEVITGHRHYPDVTRASSDDYIELVLKKWRDVLQRPPGYESLETECEQIKRCIQIGLICMNPDRKKRPPITKVISMLQGLDTIDCDNSNEEA